MDLYPTITLTIQVVHLESVRVLGGILHWNLDDLAIFIPDLDWSIFHYSSHDLWVFLGKPSEQSWDTLYRQLQLVERSIMRLTIFTVYVPVARVSASFTLPRY